MGLMNLFPRRNGPVHIEGRGYWRRLNDALVAARDGDVIRVQPGHYVESLHIRRRVSIEAEGAGVQLVGVDTEATVRVSARARLVGVEIVLAGPASRAQAVAVADGQLWLESCTIRSTCAGVIVWGPESSLRIESCRVLDTGDNGIVVADGATCECEKTEVARAKGKGILAVGRGTKLLVQRSRIFETESFGVQVLDGASAEVLVSDVRGCRASGLVCRDPETSATFSENQIHDSAAHGVEVGTGATASVAGNRIRGPRFAGVSVYGDSTRATVLSNFITGAQGHGIQVVAGAFAEIRQNAISDASGAGVVVGEPGSRALIEQNQIDRAAAGLEVVNQGWADVCDNKVASTGHAVRVSGKESFARITGNRLTSPVPDSLPVDGPGATMTVGAGDIAVVLVHRQATAVIQGNHLVGGRMPIAWVTGSFVETAGNVQDFGDKSEPVGNLQLFSEDIFG